MKAIIIITIIATLALIVYSADQYSDTDDSIYFPTDPSSLKIPVHPPTSSFPLLSSSSSERQYSDAVVNFAWKLFSGSKQVDPLDNLVLSPVLLQLLLAILEKAAAGETKRQLQEVIGITSTTQELNRILRQSARTVQLESATGFFIDSKQKLNQSFIDEALLVNSNVLSVDFQNSQLAKTIINTWVSDATHGQISNLLSPSYDVRNLEAVLATAVYFQSTWKYKFNRTNPGPFYSTQGKESQAEYMETKQNFVVERMNFGQYVKGTAIEIPYVGDNYVMIVMVPDEKITLDDFIRHLDVPTFDRILNNLSNNGPKLVTLKMPKFKADSRFSLVNSLIKMGLVDLFTIQSNLPYLGLKETPQISDILQQAILNVDEEGTIATAATSALLIPLSLNYDDNYTFVINKPFISIIFDKKNHLPLFISKIYKP